MSQLLSDLLLLHESHLTEKIGSRLRKTHTQHYRDLDADILENRMDNLVHSFQESIQSTPGVFVNYIAEVARSRIREGVFLNELQIVLNILEENSWKLAVEFLPKAELVESLSRITGTIGAAKDEVAAVYVRHLEVATNRVVDLEKKIGDLSKGTVSNPVSEDDLPRPTRKKG